MSRLVEAVRTFLHAFWNSDWEQILDLLAESAVYEDPLLDEPVQGKQAIKEVFEYCHDWADIDGEIRSVFGSGNMVVAELRIRGTMTKPIGDMPTSVVGKRFDFSEADVFEFDDDGKVVRETIYPDAFSMMKQLEAE